MDLKKMKRKSTDSLTVDYDILLRHGEYDAAAMIYDILKDRVDSEYYIGQLERNTKYLKNKNYSDMILTGDEITTLVQTGYRVHRTNSKSLNKIPLTRDEYFKQKISLDWEILNNIN